MAKIIIEQEGKRYETVPDENGFDKEACEKKCALNKECAKFRMSNRGMVLCMKEPYQDGDGYVHFEEVDQPTTAAVKNN